MLMRLTTIMSRAIQIISAIVITALVIFGISAWLTDPDRQVYRFDTLHYDVFLLADGSAAVEETRTYTFSRGRFSYGWFELAVTAQDIRVREEGQAYTRLESFSVMRTPGTYATEPEGDLIRLEWYYEAVSPSERTFQISYIIPGAAIAYTDCVVYFQKYLSEINTARIGQVSVSVRLPAGLDSGNTLIWGHGPLDGTIAFAPEDPSRIDLVAQDIGKNQFIEIRAVLISLRYFWK